MSDNAEASNRFRDGTEFGNRFPVPFFPISRSSSSAPRKPISSWSWKTLDRGTVWFSQMISLLSTPRMATSSGTLSPCDRQAIETGVDFVDEVVFDFREEGDALVLDGLFDKFLDSHFLGRRNLLVTDDLEVR